MEQPSLQAIHRLLPERVIREVRQILRLDEEEVCRRGGGWQRSFLMECLYRYSGLTQEEIWKRMGGVGYSRVRRARAELKRRMQEQPETEKTAKKVERILENQK